MSSAPSEGGGGRGKEVSKYSQSYISQILLYFTIPQPPAKPKGKPETGTLRKETSKREAKREEEPKREEPPKKRDVSPEEKIISRRKRHDSDEGEPEKNHFFLSNRDSYLDLLWVLCFPIFTLSHTQSFLISSLPCLSSHPFFDQYIYLLQYSTPQILHMQTQPVRNYTYRVFVFFVFCFHCWLCLFKLSNFSRC